MSLGIRVLGLGLLQTDIIYTRTFLGPLFSRSYALRPSQWVLAPTHVEVRCTYNLLSSCSYTPIISMVTVVTGFVTGL